MLNKSYLHKWCDFVRQMKWFAYIILLHLGVRYGGIQVVVFFISKSL